jgi:hypothetical protein
LAIVQTIPHPVISSSARDPLFPVADCNISVSLNKSLRQIANPSYNVHVENHVQALTKSACFFAPISRCPRRICDILRTRAAYKPFVSRSLHTLQNAPLATQVFSITCTLFGKQPGDGVGRFTNAFPFWERHLIAIAAIVSQIAGLSPRSWRDCARRTHRRPRMAANLIRRSQQRAGRPIQLSLAIKKQSIPNLPPIGGNERKANNVYKVFRKAVLILRRIDR